MTTRLVAPPGTLGRDTLVHLLAGVSSGPVEIDLSEVTFFTPWGVVGLCNLLCEIVGGGFKPIVKWPENDDAKSYLTRIHLPQVLTGLEIPCDSAELMALARPENPASEYLLELFYLADRSNFYNREGRIIQILKGVGMTEDVAYYVFSLMGEAVDNSFEHNLAKWPITKFKGGFFTIQKYSTSNRLEIAISDMGIGVRSTLTSNPIYNGLASDVAAVQKALERNVTSRPQQRGGNGLPYILDALNQQFRGTLDIRSGRCHLRVFQSKQIVIDSSHDTIGTIVGITVNY